MIRILWIIKVACSLYYDCVQIFGDCMYRCWWCLCLSVEDSSKNEPRSMLRLFYVHGLGYEICLGVLLSCININDFQRLFGVEM